MTKHFRLYFFFIICRNIILDILPYQNISGSGRGGTREWSLREAGRVADNTRRRSSPRRAQQNVRRRQGSRPPQIRSIWPRHIPILHADAAVLWKVWVGGECVSHGGVLFL